jgi:hypothetical protein
MTLIHRDYHPEPVEEEGVGVGEFGYLLVQ